MRLPIEFVCVIYIVLYDHLGVFVDGTKTVKMCMPSCHKENDQLLAYIEESGYVSTRVDSIAFTAYDSYISMIAVDLRVTTLRTE